MRSYGGWLVGTLAAIGVPYAGEKWANQEPPKRSLEWIVVLALVIILPLMLAAFEDKLKKWFLNRFSPAEVSTSELKHLRHFIGVDHLRIQEEFLGCTEDQIINKRFGSVDDEKFFDDLKEKRTKIREGSSIKGVLEGEFGGRHFPAPYGTAGLVCEIVDRETHGSFSFDSIQLIITEPIPEKVKVRYKEYAEKLLKAIGVLSERGTIYFDFQDVDFVNTKLEGLKSHYEAAAHRARTWSRDFSGKVVADFQIGVDVTGGTVLHSLAAAKVAEEFEPLLIYNGSQRPHSANTDIKDLLKIVKV